MSGAAEHPAFPVGTPFPPPWGPAITAADQIIYGDTTGKAAVLAPGSVGQVLTLDPITGHLEWATPAAGIAWPLTAAGDQCFRPDGVANDALCITNAAAATSGLKIVTTSSGEVDLATKATDTSLHLKVSSGPTQDFVFDSSGSLTVPNLVIANGTCSARLQGGGIASVLAVGGTTPQLRLKAGTGSLVTAMVGSTENTLCDSTGQALFNGQVDFHYLTQSTVGAAGAASALPATPSAYIKVKANGTSYVIPAYLP